MSKPRWHKADIYDPKSEERADLIRRLAEVESLKAYYSNHYTLYRNESGEIRAKLKLQRQAMGELELTDHAVLRYLERIKGIDVQGAAQELIDVIGPLELDGPMTRIPVGDYVAVIVDNLVITVKPGAPRDTIELRR